MQTNSGSWQTRKNCRRWFYYFFIRVCALKFGCSQALVVVSSGVVDMCFLNTHTQIGRANCTRLAGREPSFGAKCTVRRKPMGTEA